MIFRDNKKIILKKSEGAVVPWAPPSQWPMLKHIEHAIVKLLFPCERNLTIKKGSVNIEDNATVLGYFVNEPQQVMNVPRCR